MKEYVFIINPVSGSGNKQKTIDCIDKVFGGEKLNYSIRLTEYAGHAKEIAENLSKNSNCVAVAVGGDGSVNEVAQGIMGGKASMAILPQGSGNGLARHLKIPMAIEPALLSLLDGESVLMDAGSLNGKSFFVTCGIGFDAEVSYNFSQRSTRGLLGYVAESLALYPLYRAKKYRIISNNELVDRDAFSISIANASQYGNDAVIAKDASVVDGLLDLCIIKKFPKILGAQVGISMFLKNLHQSNYYIGQKINELIIESLGNDQFCKAHIDGESIETSFPINIKVLPKSVRIIAPKSK